MNQSNEGDGWVVVAIILILLAYALSGCGGGGDDEPEKVRIEQTEEPPCKSVPADQRQAECGS